MILEFWDVVPDQGQVKTSLYSRLTNDPHDPANWSLIATRFPWLADVIPPPMFTSVTGETSGQGQHDVSRCLAVGLSAGSSLADIAEALTGTREYGGATYTRVKRVKKVLESTTTTLIEGSSNQINQKAA